MRIDYSRTSLTAVLLLLLLSVFADLCIGNANNSNSAPYDDADPANSIDRVWRDYERNNLLQIRHEMSIRVNHSAYSNNYTYCVFKHSRAYNASRSGTRGKPVILFTFYEEIRSFHLAVRVLKERIIDQLKDHFTIKLAVFFRHAVENEAMNDLHPASEALYRLKLMDHVQVIKFNTRLDEQKVIHRLNNATRENVFLTHRGPLFVQYAQRYLAGVETRRIMEDYMAHGERVEFVFFLRTDVIIPHIDLSPLLLRAAELNVTHSRSSHHEFMLPAYGYTPQEEDWGGLNDRFALFSACGFHLYAGKFLDVVIRDLNRKVAVQGELQHMHVWTYPPTIEIRRIPVCYGVFRRFNCQWAFSNGTLAYGQADCQLSGIPHPSRYNFTFVDDPCCETDMRLKDGDLVRSGSRSDNQKLIWLISNGTKRAVRNGGIFVRHGWDFGMVKVSPVDLSIVPNGPNVD